MGAISRTKGTAWRAPRAQPFDHLNLNMNLTDMNTLHLDTVIQSFEDRDIRDAAERLAHRSASELLGADPMNRPRGNAVLAAITTAVRNGAKSPGEVLASLREAADEVGRRRAETASNLDGLRVAMKARRAELERGDDALKILARALRGEVARLRAAVDMGERPGRASMAELIASGFDPEQARAAIAAQTGRDHARRLAEARRLLGLPDDAPLALPSEAELIAQRCARADRLEPVAEALRRQLDHPLRVRPAELPAWVDDALKAIQPHANDAEVLALVPA